MTGIPIWKVTEVVVQANMVDCLRSRQALETPTGRGRMAAGHFSGVPGSASDSRQWEQGHHHSPCFALVMSAWMKRTPFVRPWPMSYVSTSLMPPPWFVNSQTVWPRDL